MSKLHHDQVHRSLREAAEETAPTDTDSQAQQHQHTQQPRYEAIEDGSSDTD